MNLVCGVANMAMALGLIFALASLLTWLLSDRSSTPVWIPCALSALTLVAIGAGAFLLGAGACP